MRCSQNDTLEQKDDQAIEQSKNDSDIISDILDNPTPIKKVIKKKSNRNKILNQKLLKTSLKINQLKKLKRRKQNSDIKSSLFEKNISIDNDFNNDEKTEPIQHNKPVVEFSGNQKKDNVSIGTDPIEMISKGTQIYTSSYQPGAKRKFKNIDTSFYEEPINNKKNMKNLHKSITFNTSYYPELFSNKLPLNNSLDIPKIQTLEIAPNIRLTRGKLQSWENY